MSTPKTIETRIRDKSAEQLRREIEEIFRPITKMRHGRTLKVEGVHRQLTGEAGGYIKWDDYDLLEVLKKHLFKINEERSGDMAVRAFMEQVDTFQEQLDHLREGVYPLE